RLCRLHPGGEYRDLHAQLRLRLLLDDVHGRGRRRAGAGIQHHDRRHHRRDRPGIFWRLRQRGLQPGVCLRDPGPGHPDSAPWPVCQRPSEHLRMTQYLVSVLTEGAVFGIMALGLNVIWGWSGDFDLAYYGYVALAAYMTLVLTIGPPSSPTRYILGLTLPYPVAVVLAVISAMALALVIGLIALRHLRGIYFSIVTLGAVYVLYTVAGQFVPLFNGYNGLSGLFDPMGDFFNLDFTSYPFFYLGLCVLVLLVVLFLVTRLSSSRFGLALRSLREDERAAAAFGRGIYVMKLKAYVIG